MCQEITVMELVVTCECNYGEDSSPHCGEEERRRRGGEDEERRRRGREEERRRRGRRRGGVGCYSESVTTVLRRLEAPPGL